MLHVEHHISPKVELFLRQAARMICLAGAGVVLGGMLLQTLATLLNIPAFVTVLKVVAACAVTLAAVHLWLTAVGKENKARIDELKRICEEDR